MGSIQSLGESSSEDVVVELLPPISEKVSSGLKMPLGLDDDDNDDVNRLLREEVRANNFPVTFIVELILLGCFCFRRPCCCNAINK